MAIPADEVFAKAMSPERIAQTDARAEILIEQYRTLQQLRRARDLTQVQLATLWGKDQVSISQLEKRSDMLLSTLRSYVEAMGGSLRLIVEFPDHAPVVLAGLSEDGAAAAPPPAKRRPATQARRSRKAA